MDNFVKLEDLYDSQARRNKEKHKLYDTFLSSCTSKIKKCASVYKQYTCFYEVPPFKIGHPQYDPADLQRYIIQRLRLNGFYVREDRGGMLYISWKPEDFNYDNYNKYMEYLNRKYDDKMNTRLVEAGGTSNPKGRKQLGAPEHIGLLTYGENSDSANVVPVNLKEFEKRRLKFSKPLSNVTRH